MAGPNNVDLKVTGETYVKPENSGKKFSTKIMEANDVVQPIIIGVGFLQAYGRVLDFTEQQVVSTHPDSTKVTVKILLSNYED